jgi:lysophospholipase L1-like esterase
MLSRRFLARLALCALLASAVFAVVGHGASQTGAGTIPRVIVLGDSISASCCAPLEETWPVIFSGRLGADVVNLAIPGETSGTLVNYVRAWPTGRTQSQLGEALSVLADSQMVAAVTLGIGTGDVYQIGLLRDPDSGELCSVEPTSACDMLVQAAFDSFRENLHLILDSLGAALDPGTPLLVMTAYWGGHHRKLNDIILAEVAEHHALLADVAEYFHELDMSELTGDGIHKTAPGHRIIADVFSNAVPPDSDGDRLSDLMEDVLGADPHVEDSDGDGCRDGYEFGPRAEEGGRRDPTNPWDYFNPTSDGQNRIDDLLAVVRHYFLEEGDPEYDVRYDRTYLGPNAWNLGPPDGRILVHDIVYAMSSFYHDCGTGAVDLTPTFAPMP